MVKTTVQNGTFKINESDKILTQIDEILWTGGKVNLVQTNQKDRAIYVGSSSAMTVFKFPPNAKDFEEELIRAQETDRTVNVSYTVDANKEKIIMSVLLYGRAAYSS